MPEDGEGALLPPELDEVEDQRVDHAVRQRVLLVQEYSEIGGIVILLKLETSHDINVISGILMSSCQTLFSKSHGFCHFEP